MALLLALACTGLHFGAVAQEGGDAYELHVKPSICVSYDSEAPCRMAMEVSWESLQLADVCLREDEADTMVRCWDNARHGSVELNYADSRDVWYRLVDAASHDVLAEAEVVVINRDLRDSRKRRRHVWSIL